MLLLSSAHTLYVNIFAYPIMYIYLFKWIGMFSSIWKFIRGGSRNCWRVEGLPLRLVFKGGFQGQNALFLTVLANFSDKRGAGSNPPTPTLWNRHWIKVCNIGSNLLTRKDIWVPVRFGAKVHITPLSHPSRIYNIRNVTS